MRFVPIIDLNRFEQGASERRTFLLDLRAAARDIGFLISRRPWDLCMRRIHEVLNASRRFLRLIRSRQAGDRDGELPAFPRL